MLKRLMLIFALVFTIGGCASINESGFTGDSPAQAIFAVKSGYATALKAAVAYKELPTCSATIKNVCSDPKVVDQIQRADNVTFQAITAAQAASDTLGTQASRSAISAARAALSALVTLVTTGVQ